MEGAKVNWIYKLVSEFLEDNGIDRDVLSLIDKDAKKLEEQFPNALNHPVTDKEYIYKILCEKYNLNSQNVKAVAEILNKDYKIGRNSKKALKKYLDYRSKEDLESFINSLKVENDIDINREYIENQLMFCEPIPKDKIKNMFITLWNEAIVKEDYYKIKDYLLGIYSKLFSIGLENLRLIEIFNSEENRLKEVFNEESIIKLKQFCLQKGEPMPAGLATKVYNEKYMQLLKKEYQQDAVKLKLEEHMNQYYVDENINKYTLLHERGYDIKLLPTEEYELVHFHIDQELYNRFNNEEKFLDYVLSYIKQIYRVLANEKVFTLKIENIYTEEGKNLKWDLYSKLTIYAEHFIQYEENARFYKAHELALDMLKKHDFKLLENDSEKNRESLLKKYYSNSIDKEKFYSSVHVNLNKDDFFMFLDRFKFVHYGFDFNDCIIIDRIDKNFYNGELNDIIKNTTEILLVFYKFRADQRRIPCPSCGSINVSGNSYPKLNNRSWECKSPYCPDRSKSNRGKRYSKKSNYMQWGSVYPKSNDIIPRELISKWRRDIVKVKEEQEIFEMIIKYFSFTDEKILFINTDEQPSIISQYLKRNPVVLSNKVHEKAYTSDIVIEDCFEGEIEFFNNGEYLKKFTDFLLTELEVEGSSEIGNFLDHDSRLKLIHGDSNTILKSVKENRISAAVTSPPYYNAREYSQWPNLYLYFYDMFNIMKECYRVLKPGSIYLYNIADIADNENTVVKSNMGNKRIPLGAYTIYFFQKAGFELLDNIIWDKGEPQSNRQKNDGKFTPHYQKPLNAYEHMFIFKKLGKPVILNDKWSEKIGKWNKNIVPFSPVIKINGKGENTFGHTAPFPDDIPKFVAEVFTQDSSDIILDPFSGALTSAIASNRVGRIGLGIELSSEYIELSKKRARVEGLKVDVLYQN